MTKQFFPKTHYLAKQSGVRLHVRFTFVCFSPLKFIRLILVLWKNQNAIFPENHEFLCVWMFSTISTNFVQPTSFWIVILKNEFKTNIFLNFMVNDEKKLNKPFLWEKSEILIEYSLNCCTRCLQVTINFANLAWCRNNARVTWWIGDLITVGFAYHLRSSLRRFQKRDPYLGRDEFWLVFRQSIVLRKRFSKCSIFIIYKHHFGVSFIANVTTPKRIELWFVKKWPILSVLAEWKMKSSKTYLICIGCMAFLFSEQDK